MRAGYNGGNREAPVPMPAYEPDKERTGIEYRRVLAFLDAIKAVWLGRACLTEPGAAYLGVPFRFPTMSEQGPFEPPADVRPLRANPKQRSH